MMPVSNTVAGVVRLGNGVTTEFDFTFEAADASHIKVAEIVEQALVPLAPADYVVALGVGGGTVTISPAPAAGKSYYIYRETPQTQLVSVSSQNRYDPQVAEDVWDRLTYIAQELKRDVDRAVKTGPDADPAQLVTYIETARQEAVASAAAASTSANTATTKASEAAASAASAALYDGPWLDTVAALLADTTFTYTAAQPGTVTAGDIIRTRAEGFSYEVAASGATDQHVTTAGGVKLYVLPQTGGYSISAFGAVGDGVADDTAELQKLLDVLKANGGIGFIPKGDYRLTALLSLNTATKPWAIVGEDGAKLIRSADYGSVLNIHTTDNWRIENIEIDAGFSSFAANANHGISWSNCSNVLVRRCRVTNYKNTAIIGFTQPASLSYTNNVVEDCVTDGLNAANNGILLADLFRSGLRNCQGLNVGKTGSPCYGLQLKNGCQEGFIEGGRATGARIGIAMGNFDVSGTHARNRVSGVHVFDCNVGIAFGNAEGNLFSDLVIDMNNSGQEAVDFNLNSVGCAGRNISIFNIASSREAVRFRSGDTDNVVHVSTISNSSGLVRPIASFFSGSSRNSVTLDRYVNPTTVTSTSDNLIADTSGVSTNRASLLSFPLRFSYTIATDAITLNGPHVNVVRVDTEGGAATDDLFTINGGVDGQTITLNTTVNARDVIVKHSASGANTIRLNGSVDFTLDGVGDRLMLQYDEVLGQWCEVGRGNNV